MSPVTLDSSHIPSMLTHMGDLSSKGWSVYGCECGWIGRKRTNNVYSGTTRSCGCLKRRLTAERSRTHGHTVKGTVTPTFNIWAGMLARCSNPASKNWAQYGGRGITVCERWKSFENFFTDMGERPSDKSLDRIDNDKGYFLDNCKWSTHTEQMRNTRRAINLIYRGETFSLCDLANKAGISYLRLYKRIRRLGWSVERAVETPIRGKK